MGKKENARAKAKKMDKKTKNDIKKLERLIDNSQQRPDEEREVRFHLSSVNSYGKRVLEAQDLGKRYGERVLFRDSSFTLSRGDRVALIGANGCGKTSLVNIICGHDSDYQGKLWVSENYPPCVLTQDMADIAKARTPMEYLLKSVDKLEAEHRTILNNMGISAAHLSRNMATLSYGERMKLKLARLIILGQHFIILDEPTNHLDLHSRDMLERALNTYQGTVLLISHDIYLIEATCNRALHFEKQTIMPGKVQ